MRRGLALGLTLVLMLASVREYAASLAASGTPFAALAAGDRRLLRAKAEIALGDEARSGKSNGHAANAYLDLNGADPLATGPFVYFGALAAKRGDNARARSLFEAAVVRDARAPLPHYFLAVDAIRRGDDERAIAEFGALNSVRKTTDFPKTLADYLTAGGKIAAVEPYLASRPDMRAPLLDFLANHPTMLPVLLRLKGGATPADAPWRGKILASLVQAGRIDEAVSAWPRLTGHAAPRDPRMIGLVASGDPAPFDWAFPPHDAGIVSRGRGDALDLLYYGRDPAVLATRDLLLAPGRYRLALQAGGRGSPEALRLVMTCLGKPEAIVDRALVAGTMTAEIAVPCPAQRLEFRGVPGDSPRESEWQISTLRLEAAR